MALAIDFPEAGLFPVRCQLVLSGLPAPFVGGLLTTSTMNSAATFGGDTEPTGYTQASIATIRLWRGRQPEEKAQTQQRNNDGTDLQRRVLVQGAGFALVGAAASATIANAKPAQDAPRANVAARDNGPLGARLRGVQHFGLTVQDMERAFAFYTDVLGGTEVMRDGDFHGERIHNTLLTDQEIEARARQVNPRAMGVPDLRGGAQRLDVRFIQFDNVVIELLKYRDADQSADGTAAFAEPLAHMSPAFPRMMHICFHIRDEVDFNKFIADLEAESARRGMTQVRANRVVTVISERERLAAPIEANSNGITEGKSNGWRLIYCKGPEGEQLEFVQALGPVKRIFDEALEARGRRT